MSTRTVAIIGAGRVGGAIGRLLAQAGYTIIAVAARTRETAEKARSFIGSGEAFTDAVVAARTADIVFITTPDSASRTVCDTVAAGGGFRLGSTIVHTSGAQTVELLDAARRSGAYRAVLHPLQSVPNRALGVQNIPGSYFRVEADPEAPCGARPRPWLCGVATSSPRPSSTRPCWSRAAKSWHRWRISTDASSLRIGPAASRA